jgi:uncharacterized lipoprotein YehR (DUF1307 family)
MKNFRKIINLGIVVVSELGLTACDSSVSSQIEKCVQAGIESNGPYKTEKDKVDTEFLIRAHCLNAASGKS